MKIVGYCSYIGTDSPVMTLTLENELEEEKAAKHSKCVVKVFDEKHLFGMRVSIMSHVSSKQTRHLQWLVTWSILCFGWLFQLYPLESAVDLFRDDYDLRPCALLKTAFVLVSQAVLLLALTAPGNVSFSQSTSTSVATVLDKYWPP